MSSFCSLITVILQGKNHSLCLPGLRELEPQTPDTLLAMLSAGFMYACVLLAWYVQVSRGEVRGEDPQNREGCSEEPRNVTYLNSTASQGKRGRQPLRAALSHAMYELKGTGRMI